MCAQNPTHAGAAASLKLRIERVAVRYPEPIVVEAYLFAPDPVAGARVAGEVTTPSGQRLRLAFDEDVVAAGGRPSSGAYRAVLQDVLEDGDFRIHVVADDGHGAARFADAFPSDATGAAAERPVRRPPAFRVAADAVIHAAGYAGRGALPPSPATTLRVELAGPGCVALSWTAPRGVGEGDAWELRGGPVPPASAAAWDRAVPVAAGRYAVAGGEVRARPCGLVPGTSCFAVRSTRRDGTPSEPSNVQCAAIP